MPTALELGVRGGRWYTLMDKVCALPTLRAAFTRVKANRGAAGVDHVTVAMYEARLDANLTAPGDDAARRDVSSARDSPSLDSERAARSGARSGFRPCAIGSSKPRYVWSWNRSSTPRLPRTVTASVPVAARKAALCRAAAPAAGGLSPRGRCGPPSLLRYHPACGPARVGGVEGQRWAGARPG